MMSAPFLVTDMTTVTEFDHKMPSLAMFSGKTKQHEERLTIIDETLKTIQGKISNLDTRISKINKSTANDSVTMGYIRDNLEKEQKAQKTMIQKINQEIEEMKIFRERIEKENKEFREGIETEIKKLTADHSMPSVSPVSSDQSGDSQWGDSQWGAYDSDGEERNSNWDEGTHFVTKNSDGTYDFAQPEYENAPSHRDWDEAIHGAPPGPDGSFDSDTSVDENENPRY